MRRYGYMLPEVFRPLDRLMLKDYYVLGIPLNWKQIRRIASAISMEQVYDNDQAYDIVGWEVKSIDCELCSLYETDPDTKDSRPMMILAVQDNMKPNRWGEEYNYRTDEALLWLAQNGYKEACQRPLKRAVIGRME